MNRTAAIVARAHRGTSSAGREVMTRVKLCVMSILLVAGVVSMTQPRRPASESLGAWCVVTSLIAVLCGLGVAPLLCAIYRSNRRHSTGASVTVVVGSNAIECKSLWGNRRLALDDMLGVWIQRQSAESMIALTLRDGTTWILALDRVGDEEIMRSALGLETSFSGQVLLAVRTRAESFANWRMLSVVLAALLLLDIVVLHSYAIAVEAVLVLGFTPLCLASELYDATAYVSGEIRKSRPGYAAAPGARTLSTVALWERNGLIEVRTSAHDPTRAFEADLSCLRLLPLIGRCMAAAELEQ